MKKLFENLKDLLISKASAHPERCAWKQGDQSITYGEFRDLAEAAGRLLTSKGIQPGDRFAIFDYNTLSALLLWMGAIQTGAVPVYVNWRFTPAELSYIIEDAEISLLFYGREFSQTVTAACFDSIATFETDRLLEQLKPFIMRVPGIAGIDGRDTAIQLYTSGTTGYPRGVLVTHQSLLNMIEGMSLELPSLGPDSIILIVAPLFNIAGSGYAALGLYNGATCILVQRFNPAEVVRIMIEQQVSHVFLAPAMIQAILQLPGNGICDFSSLRSVHYGGSPIPASLLSQAKSFFACDFTQGYGLTETTGITTLLRFDDHRMIFGGRDLTGSAGRPVAGMELRIIGPSGDPLPSGEMGEVLIRGANLSSGYWKGETPFTDSDGWFHSGDVGKIDENGYLFLLDRMNDLIVSGGINIYPTEIERILEAHEEIREAAVIGIPDPTYGETVLAFVVASSKKINIDSIKTWCRDRLAGFKVPSDVIQVSDLPRNPTGKVLRRQLREPYWKERPRQI